MILEIGNKIFRARYSENGKLVIALDNDSDKVFFKNWQNQVKISERKLDYVQDIYFKKVTERGFLKNCFPILGINEDYVQLEYDQYQLI